MRDFRVFSNFFSQNKFRKTLIFSPLALALLFFSFAKTEVAPTYPLPEGHTGNGLAYSPCYTENTTFTAGEELTYKLYYNWNFVWLSAGEMTFKVIDEDDQWHFQVIGKTYDSYDWFFKVRDYYDTWVQKETGLPIMGIRNIEEGKYRLYDYLTYDQSRKTVHNDRGKSTTDIREQIGRAHV